MSCQSANPSTLYGTQSAEKIYPSKSANPAINPSHFRIDHRSLSIYLCSVDRLAVHHLPPWHAVQDPTQENCSFFFNIFSFFSSRVLRGAPPFFSLSLLLLIVVVTQIRGPHSSSSSRLYYGSCLDLYREKKSIQSFLPSSRICSAYPKARAKATRSPQLIPYVFCFFFSLFFF